MFSDVGGSPTVFRTTSPLAFGSKRLCPLPLVGLCRAQPPRDWASKIRPLLVFVSRSLFSTATASCHIVATGLQKSTRTRLIRWQPPFVWPSRCPSGGVRRICWDRGEPASRIG